MHLCIRTYVNLNRRRHQPITIVVLSPQRSVGPGADVELLEGEIRAVATDVTKLPKHCDHLDGVWQNGVVRGAPIAGGTLSFTCASGHWLSGAAKVKCDGETGKYSPAVPTCKPCAKGCLKCTGVGLTQGDCQVCDAKARYYRDLFYRGCGFKPGRD